MANRDPILWWQASAVLQRNNEIYYSFLMSTQTILKGGGGPMFYFFASHNVTRIDFSRDSVPLRCNVCRTFLSLQYLLCTDEDLRKNVETVPPCNASPFHNN
jgi:hypothetical protein